MKYAVLLFAVMFAGVVTTSLAQKPKAKPISQAYKTANYGYECYAVTKREYCEKCETIGEYGQVSTPKITCSKCEGVSNATLAKFPCSSCSNTRKVKDPNYVPPRKCEVCNGRGLVLTLGHKIQVADADYTDKLNWEDAKYACSNFGSGWRLPTIEELTGIYEFLHRKGKGNFKTDDWYWSSSENSAYYASSFDFAYGQAYSNGNDKGDTRHMRAVRDLGGPHQGGNSSNLAKESLPSASTKIIQETRIEVPIIEMEEGNYSEPEIFLVVEEMPSFPGGEEELLKFMAENTKYPPLARENGLQGNVFITFVVDERGRIDKVKVLRGIGGGCDEEAIRVVKSMPQWKPGKQRGMPVRVQYNLPFRFTLR